VSDPTDRPTARVLSVVHSVGDARLHRLCQALLDQGCAVVLEGTGHREQAPRGVEVVVVGRTGSVRRIARALVAPLRHRCDILVVVDPDLLIGGVLARIVHRVGILVADVHEDFGRVIADRHWPHSGARLAASCVSAIGTAAASRADWTLVADEHVPPMTARRRRVVTNAPVRSGAWSPQGLSRAVYVGDNRESRGLFVMIAAALRCPHWELDIVGPINDDADAERARMLIGTSDRIRLWGRQDPERSKEIAAGASVGLSILADTPAFRAAMPTKVFQYLEAGQAVVTSSLRRPSEIITTYRCGEVADTVDDLVVVFDSYHSDPNELIRQQRAARAWATTMLAEQDTFVAVCAEIVNGER